jgi:hypothetical protein
VSWQPPPTSQCNGVLQGYKLFYEPVLDDHWQGEVESTSCTETVVPGSSVKRKLKSAMLWDVMLHNPLVFLQTSVRPHDVTFQKLALFRVAAVRTLNPTNKN